MARAMGMPANGPAPFPGLSFISRNPTAYVMAYSLSPSGLPATVNPMLRGDILTPSGLLAAKEPQLLAVLCRPWDPCEHLKRKCSLGLSPNANPRIWRRLPVRMVDAPPDVRWTTDLNTDAGREC